jgi:hypothetical protein
MLMVIINQQAWQLTGKAWPWDNYFDLSQNFYPSLSVDWRFSWSQAWELQKKHKNPVLGAYTISYTPIGDGLL